MRDVLVLEQAGVSPTDTTVTFPAREGRTVVMRHVPPDNAVFAILEMPADSGASGTVTVQLRQVPGQYGLDLQATPRWPAGAALTFSFAIHFQAPDGTAEHYLSPTLYGAALGIGRVLGDGRLQFLETRRPGGDMVRASAAEPGRYLVAAPR
jgi:hypothetical protein